jgi:AcrR family transcriptional regulator
MATAKGGRAVADAQDGRGDRTRRQIKSAIAKLLSKRDVADITLADICKATHLTTGAVYFHFSGKDDAVEEMVIDEVEGIYAALLKGPLEPDFESCVRRLIASCAQYELANGRRSRAIQQVINARPRAYAAWLAAREPVVERLTALIAEARAAHGLETGSASFLGLFILNSIEDLGMDVYQWKNPTLQPYAVTTEEWVDRQARLWSWAIRAPMDQTPGQGF